MELIRELCSIGRRGPGTDAERRAANLLAARLREGGRRAEVEPTFVHPNWALVHALHAAVAIAGSLVAVAVPALGFALALGAATSAYLDLSTRAYLLRNLLFRRGSQNVVSPGARPGAPLRLILAAHYDAGRTGYLLGERSLRLARRLPARARVLLGPFRIVFWGGLAPLVPILGARMAGLDPGWLEVLQLLPTLLLLVAAFLLADVALSGVVPGAYDNASGVAAALSAAAELDREQPPHLDVWVLLTGSQESLGEGMRSFARGHRRELDHERTVILNLDSVGYGSVHYELSEGAVLSHPMDPGLISLCEALGGSGGGYEARPVRSPFPLTDAMPARLRGLRVITVCGLAEGLPPPWRHTNDDVPERVDAEALERAVDFAVALARLLDREGARRGAGEGAAD